MLLSDGQRRGEGDVSETPCCVACAGLLRCLRLCLDAEMCGLCWLVAVCELCLAAGMYVEEQWTASVPTGNPKTIFWSPHPWLNLCAA